MTNMKFQVAHVFNFDITFILIRSHWFFFSDDPKLQFIMSWQLNLTIPSKCCLKWPFEYVKCTYIWMCTVQPSSCRISSSLLWVFIWMFDTDVPLKITFSCSWPRVAILTIVNQSFMDFIIVKFQVIDSFKRYITLFTDKKWMAW